MSLSDAERSRRYYLSLKADPIKYQEYLTRHAQYCRDKQKERNRVAKERYHRLRNEWIKENGPCKLCGSWDFLEIDHIDPGSKEMKIVAIWKCSAEKRAKELAKCQILCNLCHRIKTWRDRRARKQNAS